MEVKKQYPNELKLIYTRIRSREWETSVTVGVCAVCGYMTIVEAHLIKERVVSALPGAGFLDGAATHHLHDRVQLTAQQLACLQHMYTYLYTHSVSIIIRVPS